MNRFITFSADSLGWIGLGLSLISWPATGWLGIALATAGQLLCVASLIARFYITGYNKGRTEQLKLEINRLWSAQQPFNQSGPAFQVKTFREGASK